MRIVTWNCRVGRYREKAARMASLNPDIVAVQEVESLDGMLLLAGECQPTFQDRSTNPGAPRRGIGVFSYTGVEMKAVDGAQPDYAFRRYEAVREGQAFNVAAVWTWKANSAKDSYRQAHKGLVEHAEWMRRRPTILLGDFNSNASFTGKNWRDLEPLLDGLGLQSAYHRFFDEKFGKETRATHFFRGSKESTFHLDYCFLPAEWADRITSVDVGTYDEWNDDSDHVPLIVDLDI